MGHGEDDVEVAGVEQFLLPCLEPSLACLRLALGAVAIAAGVIGDAGLVTAVAGTRRGGRRARRCGSAETARNAFSC